MNNVIGIIPVRMQSTRLPNKPLKKILNLELLRHVYERAILSLGKKNVYIAVCDKILFNYSIKLTNNVILTSKLHKNAISRSYETYQEIKKKRSNIKKVLVIQGDEPFILPNDIKILIDSISSVNKVVNLIYNANYLTALDENNVKVIINNNNQVIYMSRQIIPSNWKKNKKIYHIQSGLIGFTNKSFIEFNNLKKPEIENYESIDMNRLIYNDIKIKAVITKTKLLGIDTIADLKLANIMMKRDKLYIKYLKKIKNDK